MDFSKAFDKVGHRRLLTKLQGYGVTGKMNSWIQNWLADCTQVVVVDGEQSGPVPVTSGVPQGSFLGPCLFLFFINDMAEKMQSTVRWRHHYLLSRRQPVWCHGSAAWPWPPCRVGADLADGIPSRQVPGTTGHQQTPPKHQRVEMVQWRAACWVCGKFRQGLNCTGPTEMISHLGWPSLEVRRKVARLTLLYKMANNLVLMSTRSLLIPAPRSTRATPSHAYMPMFHTPKRLYQ